jgi:uncharacterized protein (DUF1330 family)
MSTKGYWIAHLNVRDTDRFKDYQVITRKVIEDYGGRMLVRYGRCDAHEGPGWERHVIIEWPDYDTALRAYRSHEYTEAIKIRHSVAEGEVVVVEGWGGVRR